MSVYNNYYNIVCVVMMISGIAFILDCFYSPSDFFFLTKRDVIPIAFQYDFKMDNFVSQFPLFLLAPASIGFYLRQYRHPEFISVFSTVIGSLFIASAVLVYFYTGWLMDVVVFVALFIALVVAGLSVQIGHLHSLTRMLILLAILAVYLTYTAVMDVTDMHQAVTLINLFSVAFADMMNVLLLVFFGCLCIYPEDFPSVRLNRQVRDFEMALPTGRVLTIARRDLDTIFGANPESWHLSPVPGVEKMVTVPVYGSNNMTFSLTAIKWVDDDGMYVTFRGFRNNIVSMGKGFKIIHHAYDNTDHVPGARLVRFYTDDGFFFRLAETEERPARKPKYRSMFNKLIDD